MKFKEMIVAPAINWFIVIAVDDDLQCREVFRKVSIEDELRKLSTMASYVFWKERGNVAKSCLN